MSLKQLFLTLIVLFVVDTVAMSQVKKQYRDDVHKSTTIVIKEEGTNDLDILNQFDLNDYKVNEQIKITTNPTKTSASNLNNNVSGGQTVLMPALDSSNATASTTPIYERPKTKMKRWSVREKKEANTTENALAENTEEKATAKTPATLAKKPSRTKSTSNAKKSSSRKYRKKSKKVKRKKRVKKLKNRKRKIRRNKKVSCYKF